MALDWTPYQKQFKEWWAVARRSEEPPAPYDSLVNMRVKTNKAKNLLWDIIQRVMDSGIAANDPNGYEYEVLDGSIILPCTAPGDGREKKAKQTICWRA